MSAAASVSTTPEKLLVFLGVAAHRMLTFVRRKTHLLVTSAVIGFLVPASCGAITICVDTEIDDDNIIASYGGSRYLLKKWSLKFSPLVFEGKCFAGKATSFGVEMYVPNKGKIKWDVVQALGASEGRKIAGNDAACVDDMLRENIDSGRMLLLSSGTLMKVLPGDNIDSMLWLPISSLLVCGPDSIQAGGKSYQVYKIINTDDGESVSALRMK